MLIRQQLDSAFALSRYGLVVAGESRGESDTATATWLNLLAICHFHSAALDSAEHYWMRALTIWTDALGGDDPHVAKTYNNLGTLFREQGRFDDAIPLLSRALSIWETAYGVDDPRVAPAANNLAYTLYQSGDLSRAEPLFRRANRLWSDAYGNDYPHAIRSRINLGMLYAEQGRFTDAEPLFRETLELQEKSLGPNHPDIAYNLNNLSQVCLAENRRLEARRYSERALHIYESALGVSHPYVAYCLSSLARLQLELGNYAEAERMLLRALEIARAAYGENHLVVAQSLNDLGIVYENWRHYEQAEQAHRRALAIRELLLGPRHPQVAQSWHNLAAYYLGQGQLDQARALNRLAYGIWRENYGDQYYQLSECLLLTANIAARSSKAAEAADAAWRALVIRRANFEKNATALSEHDALHYARLLREAANRFLSYALDAPAHDSVLTLRIADAVISTKGQVADQIFLRRATHRLGETRIADLSQALKALKFRLASLYYAGPGDDLTTYKNECDKLSDDIAARESELARISGDDTTRGTERSVRIDDILRKRPQRTCLVEYMRFRKYSSPSDDSTEHYVAIVCGEDGDVDVIPLGPAAEIDRAVRAYREHLTGQAALGVLPDSDAVHEYRKLAGRVYEVAWRPLLPMINTAQKILVAGDGLLNLVAVGALPSEAGRYVLEDYVVHYASALRDIVRKSDDPGASSGLLALGDPDFFAGASDRAAGAPDGSAITRSAAYALVRSASEDCLQLTDLVVSPLPGTRVEVERIADVWRSESRSAATVLIGAAASEESFKRMAAGHHVLHLATHGYYLPADCSGSDSAFSGQSTLEDLHPLLRSGLLLAGANLHQEPDRDSVREDGNLSAYEVAELDLAGTRLVVLSACETGLGEIMDWEGVYGLRRAFLLAGAEAVISALWSVSDDHTVEIMARLYEGGIDHIADRLRRVQLDRLSALRAAGVPDHPLAWGAFIAVGGWR